MSFKALSWAWEADTETPGRKLVLVGLAQFANEKHECWPSQKTLAERTLQSERTVREHLAWLEEAGFITRTPRKAGEHRFDSDLIRLHVERIAPLHQEQLAEPAADFAGGKNPAADSEKTLEPAADFAGTQRQISPPNLQGNLHEETPIPPKPPKGGERSGRKRRERVEVKPDQFDHLIPLLLQTEEFIEAWHFWVEHRNVICKPMTDLAAKMELEDLSSEAVNPHVAVAWIRKAIKSRWQGIYAPKVSPIRMAPATEGRSAADTSFLEQLQNRKARTC